MINREDMLELTRRMTPARTSFVRMAGCYTDSDGEYDGSFNIHFLKLSGSEKARNLAIAKKIPFAESNEKLREYRFPVTIFLISGIFPLVPGAGIYWTVYYLVTEQLGLAVYTGYEAVKAAVAIVLGIVFVFELPQGVFRWMAKAFVKIP